MFNFFKKQQDGYPTVVKDIHNAFNVAGGRLLNEAKEIVAGLKVVNEDKVTKLNKFGFRSVPEVTEAAEIVMARREKEETAKALEYFLIHFPQYKFITTEEAQRICKKYNLYIGDVSQFKGFVPEKNLNQINTFFKEENEINTSYTTSDYSGRWRQVEKETYEQGLKNQKEQEEFYDKNIEFSAQMRRYIPRFNCSNTDLKIAAPIKDMDTRGYKVSGHFLVKEIPDPVVLAPIVKYGIELYCIVTAWGDEASDEIVVNQISN